MAESSEQFDVDPLCFLAAAYLLSTEGDGARMAYPAGMVSSLAAARPVVGCSDGAFAANTETPAPAFNGEYGPLATPDGHSILPGGSPRVPLRIGETRVLLSGMMVNCGSEPLTVIDIETIPSSADAAQALETLVMPLVRDDEPDVSEGYIPLGVAVSQTGRADLGLYSSVKSVADGFYCINGLTVRYRYQGRSRAQVFATNVAINVSGGP